MKIKKEYVTVLTLTLGFIVIGYLFNLSWLLYLSFGIVILSIFSFHFAKLIADNWMRLGKFLGAINSKIILSIFFVFIIVPLSSIKKIFEKKTKEQQKSNWLKIRENEIINFKNPW